MDSEPQPDGQNIQDIHLRTAWVLHRAWIRSLHYRSLSLGNKDFGFRQIKDILHLAAIFLAFELQDHGFNPAAKQQNFSHLHGLQSMYNEVLKALENIGTDLARERRPLTGNATYTVDETIAYNIFPERFSKILREHFEPLGSAWRFYAELWERASDFERAHDYEHVEDCLVNKRIVYGDEWSQLTKAKQLYYICDTKPGAGDELISHIEEFYDRLDSLKDTFPTPPRQHIPTNIANMVSCLFPIHPLAITYLPEFLGGSKCIICQEEFAESPNQIIVQLHCDHAHHYLCVRDYWDDSDTLYGARCPLCRSSGKEWNLHTTAGIAVECLDVWDYERVHPRPLITRGLEDHISDTYKIFEDEKLQQSYLYDELGLGGYRDADDPDTAFVRMPEIEMAVVRWARRKTNAQRRNLHAHLRQSVHSLDPNFVPPALGPQGLGMSPCGPGRDPNFQPSTAISSDDDSDMEDDADMEDGVDMDDDADMEYDA
ncbi:hypothetical protein N431DRAFT_393498 [Stipitochalara longipes BDJ]|nr:hypothetical protein N431DRAFT_393498 [Stipitochalara longipes BDJ]